VLQVNATKEVLIFEPVNGAIPDRGSVQDDINLFAMAYLQSWESGGTAYYRYQNADGQWVEVNDVPVKKVDIPAGKAA
jgi:hypothetical protein